MKIRFPKHDVDFIFASSSINVRENKSTLYDTTEKVKAAPDFETAMKIFSESGLDDGGDDFMTALDKRADELYAFLREVTDANSEPIIAYLNAKQEILELKTAIKGYVFATENDTSGGERLAAYSAMAAAGDFAALGEPILTEAAEAAVSDAAAGRDPQVVDFILDRALFAYRKKIAEGSGIKYLRTVCARDIDIKNLCAVFRMKRQSVSAEAAEKLLYDGGNVSRDDLLLLMTKPDKAVYNIRKTELGETVKELVEGGAAPSECEKELNAFYYGELEKAKSKNYGGDKVVAYAILYEKGLRDLSLLLTAKKVGREI